MFKSIRIRALFFSFLFIFPVIFTARTLQLTYINSLFLSSFDEQIKIRLVLLGTLKELYQSNPSNKSNESKGKDQVRLMEGLLPADFFDCKLMNIPLFFSGESRGKMEKSPRANNFPRISRTGAFALTRKKSGGMAGSGRRIFELDTVNYPLGRSCLWEESMTSSMIPITITYKLIFIWDSLSLEFFYLFFGLFLDKC